MVCGYSARGKREEDRSFVVCSREAYHCWRASDGCVSWMNFASCALENFVSCYFFWNVFSHYFVPLWQFKDPPGSLLFFVGLLVFVSWCLTPEVVLTVWIIGRNALYGADNYHLPCIGVSPLAMICLGPLFLSKKYILCQYCTGRGGTAILFRKPGFGCTQLDLMLFSETEKKLQVYVLALSDNFSETTSYLALLFVCSLDWAFVGLTWDVFGVGPVTSEEERRHFFTRFSRSSWNTKISIVTSLLPPP